MPARWQCTFVAIASGQKAKVSSPFARACSAAMIGAAATPTIRRHDDDGNTQAALDGRSARHVGRPLQAKVRAAGDRRADHPGAAAALEHLLHDRSPVPVSPPTLVASALRDQYPRLHCT